MLSCMYSVNEREANGVATKSKVCNIIASKYRKNRYTYLYSVVNNSPRKTSMTNQFCSYLQFSTQHQTQRASLLLRCVSVHIVINIKIRLYQRDSTSFIYNKYMCMCGQLNCCSVL